MLEEALQKGEQNNNKPVRLATRSGPRGRMARAPDPPLWSPHNQRADSSPRAENVRLRVGNFPEAARKSSRPTWLQLCQMRRARHNEKSSSRINETCQSSAETHSGSRLSSGWKSGHEEADLSQIYYHDTHVAAGRHLLPPERNKHNNDDGEIKLNNIYKRPQRQQRQQQERLATECHTTTNATPHLTRSAKCPRRWPTRRRLGRRNGIVWPGQPFGCWPSEQSSLVIIVTTTIICLLSFLSSLGAYQLTNNLIANNLPPKFSSASQLAGHHSSSANSEIVVRVKEGPQSIGKLIYTLRGEDPDDDPLTFGVLGSMASELLRIENVPGNQANVYLRKELDRETTESHQIVITLTDGKLGRGNWVSYEEIWEKLKRNLREIFFFSRKSHYCPCVIV